MKNRGIYAQFAGCRGDGADCFVAAGFSSAFHSRPVTLYFACYWNHFPDCLARAANENQTLAMEIKQ
jgi:hypothetical protein